MIKDRTFLSLLGATALSFSDSYDGDRFRTISMIEAKKIMESGEGFTLVDVRTPPEYAEGRIPGAVLLPNEIIGAGGSPGEEALSLLPDKGQKILVYCHSGMRSRQAAVKLAEAGYANVVDIGGIISWEGELER